MGSATVVQVFGTCNCTITGNITGSATTTNSNAVIVSRFGSFYALADLPVCTINGNILGGSVGLAEGVRLWGGTLTVNGSITGGPAGNSCSGLVCYNSENQPFDVTINTGPVTGGTSTGSDSHGIAMQTQPLGLSEDASILRVNCNIASGTNANRNRGVATTVRTIVTGNIVGGIAHGLLVNAARILVSVTGNITGGFSGSHGIDNTASTSNVTVVGNVTGGSGSNSWGIYNTRGIITITGNVYGGVNNEIGTVNLYGDSYGGTGGISTVAGIRNGGSGTVNIYGNAYGLTTGTAINPQGAVNASTGIINVFGIAQAGTIAGSHGVRNSSTGIVRVKRAKGNGYGLGSTGIGVAYGVATDNTAGYPGFTYVEELEFGSRGASPVLGNVYLTSVSTNTCVVTLTTSAQKTLVDANSIAGLLPSTSDVRSGVSYNLGNNIGTCAVPSVNSVAAGVSVDNSVGVATLSPEKVWDYAGASTSGSVNEKLRKTAIPADIIALG